MSLNITDVHVHIQPWRELKPDVQAAMRAGKEAHWDFLRSLMNDPQALLDVMDRSVVCRTGPRAALVHYPLWLHPPHASGTPRAD